MIIIIHIWWRHHCGLRSVYTRNERTGSFYTPWNEPTCASNHLGKYLQGCRTLTHTVNMIWETCQTCCPMGSKWYGFELSGKWEYRMISISSQSRFILIGWRWLIIKNFKSRSLCPLGHPYTSHFPLVFLHALLVTLLASSVFFALDLETASRAPNCW